MPYPLRCVAFNQTTKSIGTIAREEIKKQARETELEHNAQYNAEIDDHFDATLEQELLEARRKIIDMERARTTELEDNARLNAQIDERARERTESELESKAASARKELLTREYNQREIGRRIWEQSDNDVTSQPTAESKDKTDDDSTDAP